MTWFLTFSCSSLLSFDLSLKNMDVFEHRKVKADFNLISLAYFFLINDMITTLNDSFPPFLYLLFRRAFFKHQSVSYGAMNNTFKKHALFQSTPISACCGYKLFLSGDTVIFLFNTWYSLFQAVRHCSIWFHVTSMRQFEGKGKMGQAIFSSITKTLNKNCNFPSSLSI